ncbi:hypothetical protein OWR29_13805 [Actinoplanes sp. Pm04-4]|uniref:Uncharacterized protein n=1 Tax=Paractinoplanes pyxinae TaxID=2997416 RepID=A0ABT4AXV0_9ACTN|nr:hypothetical protein [Actinoplanes pyxinae]MCY1139067.1 hypothetical protein [Actinoplanes pyxinae]
MSRPSLNELDQLAALDPMRDFEPTPERRARATAALDETMRLVPTSHVERRKIASAGLRERMRLVFAARPAGLRETARPAGPRETARFVSGSARRPVGRRLVFSGAALAVAATVAVAAVQFVPGEDGNRAYAWTATPKAVPDADALAQARQCAAGWSDGRPAPTAADIVLSERRGTATLLLVKNGAELTSCFVLDPAQGPAGGDLLDTSAEPPAAGRVLNDSMGATEGSQGWYSSLIGRAGAGVEKVEIELPDGTKVRASLKNGWWAAWWPGAEGGKADGVKIVVDADGKTRSFKPSEIFATQHP